MWSKLLLYGAVAFFVLPLVVNVYFYFVEQELQSDKTYNQAAEIEMRDGKSVYLGRCAGCHGTNGDGGGGFPRVNGEGSGAIYAKLLGYKNGTYGGAAKGVMVQQLQDIPEATLQSIAAFLAKRTPVFQKEPTIQEKNRGLNDFDISS